MIRQDDKQLQGGDKVLWRGGFGTHQPQVATVMDMAITEGPRQKYGASVVAVDWTVVRANRAALISITATEPILCKYNHSERDLSIV